VAAPAPLIAGLFTPVTLTMVLVQVFAVVALFHRWFFKQHQYSAESLQDWGHAYAIPFISLYLIWQKRDELLSARRTTYWPAIVPLLFGVMGYFYFVVGISNHMLQGACVIITIFALALLNLGTASMRVLFLPIMYLACAVTISEMIMIKVTFQMQLFASQGAYVLLSIIGAVFGFSAEVDGNTLHVMTASGQDIPLNVAEACSGMRMVIAFYALAGAVALISCRYWWQRIALVLMAAPVALFMNIIRVAILGIGSIFDPSIAAGDIHMFIGTLLLLPSLGLFMAVLWALNKIVIPEKEPPRKRVSSGALGEIRSVRYPAMARPAFLIPLILMVGSAVAMGTAVRAYGFHLRKKPIYAADNRLLTSLPVETMSWKRVGSDRVESLEVQEVLGTENYLTREYLKKPADGSTPVAISFHAAYYTGMIDTVPHVPDRCFVGGGLLPTANAQNLPLVFDQSRWSVDNDVPELAKGRVWRAPIMNQFGAVEQRVRLPFDPQQIKLRVTEFAAPRGDQKIYAGYFFVANGGTTPDADGVRLLAFDLKQEYAYYLKVQVTSTSVKSVDELAAEASSLIGELLPSIMRCAPDWVEVMKTGTSPGTGGGTQKTTGSPAGSGTP
jgi:exosortase